MRNRILGPAMLVAVALLAGCGPKPVDFDLEVKVRLDGKPVKGMSVLVDGVNEGSTDAAGQFTKAYARMPEKPVRVAVKPEDEKLRVKGWEQEFVLKPHKDGAAREKQSFTVDLGRYATIAALHEGKPVAGVEISVDGKRAGETQANGEFDYVFKTWPAAGLRIATKKDGFGESRLAYRGKSGDRIVIALYKDAIVQVEAFEDRLGSTIPLKGATVSLGDKQVGVTGNDGTFTYRHKGVLGDKVAFRVAAPAHLPGSYTRTVMLGGQQKIRQYFQPAEARAARVAVLNFSGNTAGEDISDAVKKIEAAFSQEMFGGKAFVQVPRATALDLVKRSKLSVEKLKVSGWRDSPLADAVDVVAFGSVSRAEGDSYVAEVSFYNSDGGLALTQVVTVGSAGSWRIGRAASEFGSNLMTLFPFAGTVLGTGDEGFRVNLGRGRFPLEGDDTFMLRSVRRNEEGRIVGASDAGTLKMRRARDDHSILEGQALKTQPRPGDMVVRVDPHLRGFDSAEHATVAVKGAEGNTLVGANVYIDSRWAGSTDRKGEVRLPLLPGREYKLLVYRHGYEQAAKAVEPAKRGERYEFALRSFQSLFTVESEPSGAAVSIDDMRVGTTPITKGYPVTRGFHTVKVDAGGDFRPWEEVLEISQKEEARTGANRVVLYKDLLRLGERAESTRNFADAIRVYGSATKEHPDYAEIHHRLGQLYFDDKHDYDKAIAEYELVQQVPEVRELVLKQFAVLYTNLGKAYYAKGEQIFRANRTEAMQYYAKAIRALDRARENTRFFPAERHDEAVHDTYYYRAMAYNSIYTTTRREGLARDVETAWQEYFDFFPPKLRGKPEFDQLRDAGERLAEQMKDR